MAVKNDIDITIGGKTITLSGVESEEYLREVAAYLNGKLRDFADDASYWRLPNDMRSIMLQLNLADDYFKERSRAESLEEQVRALEDHRDRSLAELETLQEAAQEAASRISALETDAAGLRDQAQRAAAAENSAAKRFGAEKSRAERLTEELEALRKSKAEADKAVQRLRQELAETRESTQKELSGTREDLEQKLSALEAQRKEEVGALRAQLKSQAEELKKLRSRYDSARLNEENARKKLEVMEKSFSEKLAAETESLRADARAAQEALEKAQEELMTLQEQETIRSQAAARVRDTMQELVQQYGRFGQSLEEAAEQMRTLE